MRKRARDADRRWGKGIDDEEVAMSVWREPGADARCLCDDGNVRSAISNTSQTLPMDMRLVLAIDLLDMPWSQSSIMTFAFIFLAM